MFELGMRSEEGSVGRMSNYQLRKATNGSGFNMSRAAAPPASGTKFRTQILAKPKTLLGRGRSPPKKNFSRKERKVRKEMEGGNGMSEANVVTLQQATQTPSIAVENLSGSRIKSATEIFPARRGAVPSPLDKNSINYIILKEELFNSSFTL